MFINVLLIVTLSWPQQPQNHLLAHMYKPPLSVMFEHDGVATKCIRRTRRFRLDLYPLSALVGVRHARRRH